MTLDTVIPLPEDVMPVGPDRRDSPSRLPVLAAVMIGAGLVFVVARDGTPTWQIARGLTTIALVAVTTASLRRASRLRRAGVASAFGMFAVPIGIGIAVPHVTKSGPVAVTFAGLLILGGGLVLLVPAAITLVALARRWWRVPTAAGIIVATFVSMMTLGQAVAVTNVPRTAVDSTTPADRGLRFRDVEFATDDDLLLSGWYVPSTNGAAVVLLHGAGSTRSGVLDHAVVLARQGYGVLLFDARGHGRSGGRAMDFGWYGDDDIGAAVSFLATQPGIDPERIGAVGMSMGGEEAIGAAAADARIKAVVAEGATNRVAADKVWLSDEYGMRGAVQEWLDQMLYSITDLLTAAGPPIALHDAVAAAAPRSVLLIAAGSVATEVAATRYIEHGSPQTVERWIVPETGHTAALDTHPQEWARRVGAFLAHALDV